MFYQLQTVNRKLPKIGIGVIFKLWETHEEKNRYVDNNQWSLSKNHTSKFSTKDHMGSFLLK